MTQNGHDEVALGRATPAPQQQHPIIPTSQPRTTQLQPRKPQAVPSELTMVIETRTVSALGKLAYRNKPLRAKVFQCAVSLDPKFWA